MIDPAWCRLMAAYNREMNRRLYGAANTLDEAARHADRGAFWGSIHGTLSHLLWADTLWMSRFAAWPKPAGTLKDSPRYLDDWAALQAAREKADAAIEAWAAHLHTAQLAAPLSWTSTITGRLTTMPLWIAVSHFFNHQTHHRGQAHALLTAAGAKVADTDLPWVVDLSALGLV